MTSNTIAVLPFMNINSDSDKEYFSDGITEEIINALAKINNLKVTSRTSSFFFKNKNIPIAEIASQLNVTTILEGSIRFAGDMVRITAQLIQAVEDYHFWSETWDRKLENIFEVQDEISLIIADKLREQFGHLEFGEHLINKQTNDLDAYSYSLKARFHFNKWNPVDVKKAIELYEKALKIDPDHTESNIGLADAYSFMATTEFMPREEAWRKSVEYTHRAYELDPENAGVHYLLANMSFFTDFNFTDAFKHAQKSIELKPSYPEAQQFMAFLYIISGKIDNAKHHLQLALAIDPLSQETKFYEAYFNYRTGKYKEAVIQYDDLLEKNSHNIPAIIVKNYCLLLMKDFDSVISNMNNMPKEILIPDEQLGIMTLAFLFKDDKGRSTENLELLKTRAKNPTSFQAHSYLFLSYANMNMYDEAFELLAQALKIKSSVLLLAFSDPLIGDMSNDKRYKEFHKQIYVFPDEEEKSISKKSALLDEVVADEYREKLLEFIINEKPYLNPSVTLRSLASQIEIHPNQLSWLLNEKIGKKFNEFINYYRIEHFKEISQNPANSNISILGLAYESGFNSKTSFNNFFKKEEGMTPMEYIKSLNPKNS